MSRQINKQARDALKETFNRSFVVITLAYVAGIILGRYSLGAPSAPYWGAALLILFSGALLKHKVIGIIGALFLLLAALSGGAAFYYSALPPADSILNYAGEPLYIEGTIVEEPVFYDDHSAYRLRVDVVETEAGRLSANGDLLVKIYAADAQSYWYGEKLRLRGVIAEARGQRNPGGFDYRFFLQSRGIDALIYPNASQVESLGEGINSLPGDAAIRVRSLMAEAIKVTLPSPSAELLTAILFGQKHYLPDEVAENFRRAGAGHLMAVSGLHVGLAAALILGLFKLFKLQGRYMLIPAILLVLAYAFITGLRPSAVRAAIMVSMAMGALLLDRERDLPTAVAFAALATLFFSPLLLFTVGFQLSYAATIAIIYGYRPLEQLLRAALCPALIIPPLAVTTAAQIGVLPLCIYYFQHMPTGALLFNLLLLPLLAPLIGLGLTGALLFQVVPFLGSLALWAARPLLEAMIIITGFSSHPALYIALQPPSIGMLILYYGMLALFLASYYSWERRGEDEAKVTLPLYICTAAKNRLFRTAFRRLAVTGVFLLIIITILWTGILFPADDELVVTFIDVGQGASALVETPCGLVIMIDAGGELPFRGEPGDIADRVLLPFLRYQGVRRIDLAVVTHPHEDHFGGFAGLVGTMPIKEMLISPITEGPDTYFEMLAQAESGGTVITSASAGQSMLCSSGLTLDVLSPSSETLKGSLSPLNDNSVVIMLSHQQVRILFTGDIEQKAVNELLASGIDLRADLLQVPHHGGYLEAMPALLDAVQPEIAVIQVGANPFGHPNPYIVSAIESAEVALYRNDYHGAVIVKSDGRLLQITTTDRSLILSR